MHMEMFHIIGIAMTSLNMFMTLKIYFIIMGCGVEYRISSGTNCDHIFLHISSVYF